VFYMAVQPPSIEISVPVMLAAASEQRNTTVAPICDAVGALVV
jgi:hypothetical protein